MRTSTFRRCMECPIPQCYTTSLVCEHCGSETQTIRKVSFVDSPGQETLMATMLSGAAIMDGAILVIAANEPVPSPDQEHLMALDVIGVTEVIVVRTDRHRLPERAMESYRRSGIREGYLCRRRTHHTVSAQQGANSDILIETIHHQIRTPADHSESSPPTRARSFDINRPRLAPRKISRAE